MANSHILCDIQSSQEFSSLSTLFPNRPVQSTITTCLGSIQPRCNFFANTVRMRFVSLLIGRYVFILFSQKIPNENPTPNSYATAHYCRPDYRALRILTSTPCYFKITSNIYRLHNRRKNSFTTIQCSSCFQHSATLY